MKIQNLETAYRLYVRNTLEKERKLYAEDEFKRKMKLAQERYVEEGTVRIRTYYFRRLECFESIKSKN